MAVDLSREEQSLNHELCYQPYQYRARYSDAADRHLRRVLFRSLARDRDDYLRYFFPHGPPTDRSQAWSLRSAQGAIDGAEYTAAAKGTACGHIFKSGESTYACKTCQSDDTCVLCARCFEASDHEGHTVFVSVSPGNSGCCDCGDKEAWRREVNCSIHTEDASQRETQQDRDKSSTSHGDAQLPKDLIESIRMTISRAIDYLCDVFAYSPEQLRLPKSAESIRTDERHSRLSGVYGEEMVEQEPEFVLVLWNDEKHTIDDVQNQVARACQRTRSFGREKAVEVNDVGRSCVHYSRDVDELVEMARIIEQLKVTVTIRSARDTFREQMCATIINWIADIAGCAVGRDAYLLRNIVCEELLKPWKLGSLASNKHIGQEGIDDHETEDSAKMRRHFQHVFHPNMINVIRVMVEPEEVVENNDEDDDEDDDGFELGDDVIPNARFNDLLDPDDPNMDVDSDMSEVLGESQPATDMDVDHYMDDNEDGTEVPEATLAGYPPPPPPPVRSALLRRALTPAESEDGDALQRAGPTTLLEPIPRTPKARIPARRSSRPSRYWLEKPDAYQKGDNTWRSVRLAYLILYDLRLWKTLRTSLRHLYITTVVTIPRFKRVLGLQFASLYTALAQLYLIADREPDHSIINLSVQMLTTPTIAQEVVERGNFLTNLMAILYTFLTTRQVGYPEDVNPKATLAFDAGAVTNRRIFHFYMDLRWLFQAEYIRERVRFEPRYLLQFLDLVKLLQGVCPNVRATGEHVEYEPDAWISASLIVKELNRLCKSVAASFETRSADDGTNTQLQRALRIVAQMTMINSFGYERRRFSQAEAKDELGWQVIVFPENDGKRYSIPRFEVQREPMSFHHPLHYLLSWLLENAKAFSRDELRALLNFSYADLRDPWSTIRTPTAPSSLTPDELLSAIFEHPARVYVWLSQMKAGMWVRNGATLRHQALTYRSVSHRDLGYQRDIFMIQAGLVLCGSDNEEIGERMLAQLLVRFEMTQWVKGDYSVVPGFEEAQLIDVVEDFFHLLVIVLSERSNLIPSKNQREQQIDTLKQDIAHVLCFKPLSFSDLTARVTDKVGESDDFNRVVESMTIFKAPEGLTDSGTFELKPEYVELVDPFYAHYSRNQREEAESILKKHIARKTGNKPAGIVYEPELPRIDSGLFKDIGAFTKTSLFMSALKAALAYAAGLPWHAPKMPSTRIETFLHMVLHLIVLSTQEDERSPLRGGFARLAASDDKHGPSLVSHLLSLLSMEQYSSCHQSIKHILRKLQLQHPEMLAPSLGSLGDIFDRAETDSPASVSADDKERKKQEALARQARIMAQMKQQQNSFLQTQGLSAFGEEYDDLDDMSITEEPETMSEQRKTWTFPSGTCILCQEETDERGLFGTFAFLAESNILRPTDLHDEEHVKEVFDTPRDLDRPADHLRPFGISGSNRQIVQKTDQEGNTINVERQVLSRGFRPSSHSIKAPVSTSCGHIMHFKCFELYLAATQRRHGQQIARDHPERIEVKEFVCPLCKALGNTFLPIIWKAKECAFEHELHAAKSFEDWLVAADGEYAPSLHFLDGLEASVRHHAQVQQIYEERSHKYVAQMFAPSLVASMQELNIDPSPSTGSQARMPLRRGYSLSTLFRVGRPDSQGSIDSEPMSPTVQEQPQRLTDLVKAYLRIDECIASNKLWCETSNPVNTLSRALGLSISAFEIAHRGVGSDSSSTSLIAEVSEQSLVHLRILCETVESYLAVNVLRPIGVNAVARETAKHRSIMIAQLFGVESELAMMKMQEQVGKLLFQDDVFLFFVDWLSFMAPDVAEASSILQLCYWAEIVKTIFLFKSCIRMHLDMPDDLAMSSNDAFRRAINGMVAEDMSDSSSGQPLNDGQLALMRLVIEKYALAFLRKSSLVMHVRYGLDFECPYNVDSQTAELDRLTALLHIPTIDALCGLYTTDSAGSMKLRQLTKRWLQQAQTISENEGPSERTMMMPHPAIYELIGLPKNYDKLTEEAIKRRCPTTGKEVVDPAVCLFCGDIFCSQALCCLKDNEGGCYHHMRKCGGNVGMFINIRKCMVLFLYGRKGSFAHAPYLDKHGEPDPTLRRHYQLFLNQRRYDKLLREVWLQHTIPTVISRKLEGDINPGGWETM